VALENKKKYRSHGHFHVKGLFEKIPTKKEPIRTLVFTSTPTCHIIKSIFVLEHVSVAQSEQIMSTEKYPSIFSCQMKAIVYAYHSRASHHRKY